MLMRLKKSFDEGMQKIRWLSSLLTERLKVEVAVIKLLRESDDLEKKRAELVQTIGERVFELRGQKEVNLLRDTKTRQVLKELEALDKEIEELKSQVSEIGKVE